MKMYLKSLFDITDQISDKVRRDYAYNPKRSLRITWEILRNALLAEAKWLTVGQFPTAEEYLKIANGTSGIQVLLIHTFFLLAEGITRETLHLINDDPGIISSVSIILCLCDGLGSAKDENKWGLVSYMECYIREYPGISVQDARKQVMNKISYTWKQRNQHYLSPNPFSNSFTTAALTCARLAHSVPSFDNNYTVKLDSKRPGNHESPAL